MLRAFWKNLGLTYIDIENLPYSTIEMLKEIMNLEEQFANRETKKSSSK